MLASSPPSNSWHAQQDHPGGLEPAHLMLLCWKGAGTLHACEGGRGHAHPQQGKGECGGCHDHEGDATLPHGDVQLEKPLQLHVCEAVGPHQLLRGGVRAVHNIPKDVAVLDTKSHQ